MAKNNDPNTLNLKVSMDASDAKKELRGMLGDLNDVSKSLGSFGKGTWKKEFVEYLRNAQKYVGGFSDEFAGLNALAKQLSLDFKNVQKNLTKAITANDNDKIDAYEKQIGKLRTSLDALNRLSLTNFEAQYSGFGTSAKEAASILSKDWMRIVSETNEQTKIAFEQIDMASQFVGKSAEESAEIFRSEWVATLKETAEATKSAYREIDKYFNGTTKSAKDSAAVFDEDYKKIIESTQKATKAAYEEVDRARNAGKPSKSAKDSASVFIQEDFFREDEKREGIQNKANLDFQRLITPKGIYKASIELENLKRQLSEASQKFVEMRLQGQNTKAIEKQIGAISKRMGKLEEKTRKADGPFKKLWGRIKNISIYRTIRTALKWITQGFEEGINNFVQYDERANSTMSNINASLQQIRNTMGISLISVLQAFEPLIMSITNGLVNLLDSFNLAMAKISGQETYKKAKRNVEDYAASVDEAKGSLADFDKIRSLDVQQTDPMDMFEEAKVEENENRMSNFFESIISLVKEVGAIISDVWNSLLDMGIWDILIDAFSAIAKIVGSVIKLVAQMIKGLADMGALEPILYGLVAAWMAYKVAATLAAVANAAAWMMAHPILGTAAIVAAVGTLAGIVAAFSNITKSNIPSGGGFNKGMVGLAEGGFTTANLIATNENGVREWVGTQAGATAVVNDTQMTDLMYVAVKDGCYEGVIDALSDANSYASTSGEASSTRVEIQGDALFTIISNEAAKRGLKFARV